MFLIHLQRLMVTRKKETKSRFFKAFLLLIQVVCYVVWKLIIFCFKMLNDLWIFQQLSTLKCLDPNFFFCQKVTFRVTILSDSQIYCTFLFCVAYQNVLQYKRRNKYHFISSTSLLFFLLTTSFEAFLSRQNVFWPVLTFLTQHNRKEKIRKSLIVQKKEFSSFCSMWFLSSFYSTILNWTNDFFFLLKLEMVFYVTEIWKERNFQMLTQWYNSKNCQSKYHWFCSKSYFTFNLPTH